MCQLFLPFIHAYGHVQNVRKKINTIRNNILKVYLSVIAKFVWPFHCVPDTFQLWNSHFNVYYLIKTFRSSLDNISLKKIFHSEWSEISNLSEKYKSFVTLA